VLIHDGARPFVTPDLIADIITALGEADAVLPCLPVVDALWRDDPTWVPVDRAGLLRAQTPQGFDYPKILAAFETQTNQDARDDIEVAAAAGLNITQVDGAEANFKITLPQDFERASTMISTAPDIRTGSGYDVHAFCQGDHVTLCGVQIAHEHGLKGHSDADVAMHALTDAIYGALAEGDIGTWFPPSEAQWKGAASHIFLEHAMLRARERGFSVTHLDCTMICEAPKIGPHAAPMREEPGAKKGSRPWPAPHW